jgi:hypothetical protein
MLRDLCHLFSGLPEFLLPQGIYVIIRLPFFHNLFQNSNIHSQKLEQTMPILGPTISKGSGHFTALFLLQKLLFMILYVQVLKYY